MTESERSQHHVPPDPSGIDEPHDVLAAEEFAMPAGIEPHDDDDGGRPAVRALLPLILAGLVVLIALRRRR